MHVMHGGARSVGGPAERKHGTAPADLVQEGRVFPNAEMGKLGEIIENASKVGLERVRGYEQIAGHSQGQFGPH